MCYGFGDVSYLYFAHRHEEFLKFKYSVNMYLQFIYFNEFQNKLSVAKIT